MAKKPVHKPSKAETARVKEAIAQHEAEETQADRRASESAFTPTPGLVEHPRQGAAPVVPISEGLARVPEVEKGEDVFKFKLAGTQPVHLRLPGDDPRVVDDKHKKSVEPTAVGEELELSHRQVKHLRDHGICLTAVKPEEDVPPEPVAA